MNELTECSICYEISEAEIRHLPCSHTFHATCVQTWFDNQHNTCPLCRIPIPGIPPPPTDSEDEEDLERWQDIQVILERHMRIIEGFQQRPVSPLVRLPHRLQPPTLIVTEVMDDGAEIECLVNNVPFHCLTEDVRLILTQMDVDRDTAIGALSFTGNDIVEAIMFLTELEHAV